MTDETVFLNLVEKAEDALFELQEFLQVQAHCAVDELAEFVLEQNSSEFVTDAAEKLVYVNDAISCLMCLTCDCENCIGPTDDECEAVGDLVCTGDCENCDGCEVESDGDIAPCGALKSECVTCSQNDECASVYGVEANESGKGSN